MSADVDQKLADFADNDNDSGKTWTRLIVEKYLSKRQWYFPMRDKRGGPDLSKGIFNNTCRHIFIFIADVVALNVVCFPQRMPSTSM